MMSPAFITSRLSIRLLIMMMIMIVTIMMSPSSTSDAIEITELIPVDSFPIGSLRNLRINCRYNASNLTTFSLIQNNSAVVQMKFNKAENRFETVKKTKKFFCFSRTLTSLSVYGEVECWRNNLDCSDATSYKCSLNDTDVSSPRSLKAVSSIKIMEYISGPNKWSNDSGYLCVANAVLPQKNDVAFQWEIGRYFTDKTDDRVEAVTVPAFDKCYTEISSFYPCNSLKNPGSYTSVKCTVFNQTRTRSVYTWTKDRCNTGSGVQFSKWVLIINLILLLLDVAISR